MAEDLSRENVLSLRAATEEQFSPKSPKKVTLTPEETFIMEAEGLEGLKKAQELRNVDVAEGTTLYGGIPAEYFGEVWKKHIGTPVWDALIHKRLPQWIEKIPGGKKVRNIYPKAIDKIPGSKTVQRVLDYDFRGDLPDTPKYMESLNEMKHLQGIGREYGVDLGNRILAMSERSQHVIGDILRDKKPYGTTPVEKALAVEARNSLDILGKQAVDVGLLSEETFFKNVGQYLPRLYTKKEYQSSLGKYSLKKPNRFEMSRFMKRKDIPAKVRKELGEITQPGYPVAKGIVNLTHDIEMAKHFNGIAANPNWSIIKEVVYNKDGTPKLYKKPDTYNPITGKKIPGDRGVKKEYQRTIPEDWVQLPNEKKLGQLADSYVHPEIAADILEAIKITGKGEKVWNAALGSWKFGKVILSPKTHVRNLMSNSLLAHLGGLPLWRQPKLLTQAGVEMKNSGNHWKNAKREGLFDSTWTEGELRELFGQVETKLKGANTASLPGALGKIAEGWGLIKEGGNKAAKLYNAEEQWFKLAKYIDNVERRKMSTKAAAVDAEKWLFNYSKLTKAQQKYRTKWYGAPFATFPIKAIPRIAEAAIKTPWRFAAPAGIIYGLEEAARRKFGDSKEQKEAKYKLRGEWMQGSFAGMPNFPRVPVEDDSGREYYLNLSFIVPWGDLAETGGMGPVPGGLMPLSMPFTREGFEQLLNYDNFWKEPIVGDEDLAGLSDNEKFKVQVQKRVRHLYDTLVPTLAVDLEKGFDAAQGKPDFRGRERPAAVVASDVFMGIKMYPVDYAERMMQEVSKNHPLKSATGRKIISEIRSASVKRDFFKKKGNKKRVEKYNNDIKKKTEQLRGMGRDLKKIGKEYKKIQKSSIPEGFELKQGE